MVLRCRGNRVTCWEVGGAKTQPITAIHFLIENLIKIFFPLLSNFGNQETDQVSDTGRKRSTCFKTPNDVTVPYNGFLLIKKFPPFSFQVKNLINAKSAGKHLVNRPISSLIAESTRDSNRLHAIYVGVHFKGKSTLEGTRKRNTQSYDRLHRMRLIIRLLSKFNSNITIRMSIVTILFFNWFACVSFFCSISKFSDNQFRIPPDKIHNFLN